MWVVTYKEKILTVEKLCKKFRIKNYSSVSFLTGETKAEAIESYLRHFGFTWKERDKGIEAQKVTVSCP